LDARAAQPVHTAINGPIEIEGDGAGARTADDLQPAGILAHEGERADVLEGVRAQPREYLPVPATVVGAEQTNRVRQPVLPSTSCCCEIPGI